MMQKRRVSTLLASAAIMGSSMVGCSGAATDHRPSVASNQAPALAPRVEQALASKDYARALLQAEELVAAVPNDGSYRALLGRAYLGNGRYASARTAFQDALTLGNRDVRTIVSLAMSETGLGNDAAARELLVAHIQDLPAADYGLAMAMAGEPREGVRALLQAVQLPDATAQTRQNLAYALALGGAWGQARLIAGQDLSARDAERRIGQWSQAGNAQQRVIAMIGIAPQDDDSGLPTRLALSTGNAGEEPTRMAAVEPLVEQAQAETPPPAIAQAEIAVAAPAVTPAPVVQVEQPVRVAEAKVASPDTISVAMTFDKGRTPEAPVIRASSEPMRQAIRTAFRRSSSDAEALVGRASMSRVAQFTAPASDAQASDWVIQLGAFDSAAVAKEKWQHIARGRTSLGEFHQIHSEFAKDGRTFHRLAIRGFGDRSAAWQLCQSLRAEGQSCFVRLDDTGTTRTARTEAGKGSGLAARKPAIGREVAAR